MVNLRVQISLGEKWQECGGVAGTVVAVLSFVVD